MNAEEIKTETIALETLVDKGKLYELMAQLRSKNSWLACGTEGKLSAVEFAYSSLLEFYKTERQDPQRDIVYSHVLTDLYDIIYQWADAEAQRNNATSIRYRNQSNLSPDDATSYVDFYFKSKNIYDQMSQPSVVPIEMETSVRNLFNIVWSFAPTGELCDVVSDFIANEQARIEDRILILGALILATSQRFLPRYIAMLFSLCDAPNNIIRSKATAGTMLCVVKHADRIKNESRLWAQWTNMMNDIAYKRNIAVAMMSILKTVQTSDITEKMLTDVAPTILSVKERSNKTSLHDIDWDEMMGDNQHLKKSLDKLMKWQMEGADVFLSTFSHLKDYQFFRELSNWLMPFDECNSYLVRALDDIPESYRKPFVSGVKIAPILCESDKYSVLMSFSFIPVNARENICEMYTRELEAAAEVHEGELSNGTHTCIVDQYIRDLYRIFYVHPRRKEFVNPFEALPQFLSDSQIFRLSFYDDEREAMADYMGHQAQYAMAKRIYQGVKHEEEQVQYIKKLIFCYMAEDDCQQALQLLMHLDELNGQTAWSLKMQARCYRFLSLTNNEAQCLRTLISLDSGNIELKQQLSQCYISAQQYAQALQLLYEIDYLQPTAETAYQVANCMLRVGKGADAQRYVTRTDSSNTQHQTTTAYVHLCTHNIELAIASLTQAGKQTQIDATTDFQTYRLSFEANNISLHDLKFLVDVVAK